MLKTKKILTLICASLVLSACGGGGGGGSSSGPTSVVVSGNVSFEDVPHDPVTLGLDYAASFSAPARRVVVQAVNSSTGAVLDQDLTDDSGDYSLSVGSNVTMFIRARAQLQSPSNSAATWNVAVTDNTSGNALYVLDGPNFNSGESNRIEDLFAASGWDMATSRYVDERAAAPFAILDAVYEAVSSFVAVDSDINFPDLEVRWSENNSPVGNGTAADLAAGRISTSFFSPSEDVIYILGAQDFDTDEYDSHVIAHEWGHYFEDVISRSDSIGGSHSITSLLDMRVAMSEGWGNAVSGIVLNDPIYIDSSQVSQSRGFFIDVEENNNLNRGWFNEGSVQSIIYDIYDGLPFANSDISENSDTLDGGLARIYQTFTSDNYVNSPLVTSIHLFLDEYKFLFANQSLAIDILAAGQDILVNDAIGTGENNDGGNSLTLPVYYLITLGQSQEFCVINDFGSFNRLGNRRFFLLEGLTQDLYNIRVARTMGATATDPDFFVLQQGQAINGSLSGVLNVEDANLSLPAGDLVFEVYDDLNTDSCFTLTVTTAL
ncbi:hypothetical protein [Sessilibacter sp. MAH4]